MRLVTPGCVSDVRSMPIVKLFLMIAVVACYLTMGKYIYIIFHELLRCGTPF